MVSVIATHVNQLKRKIDTSRRKLSAHGNDIRQSKRHQRIASDNSLKFRQKDSPQGCASEDRHGDLKDTVSSRF